MTYMPPELPPSCYSSPAPARAHTAEELAEAQKVLESLGTTHEELTRRSTELNKERLSQARQSSGTTTGASATDACQHIQLPAVTAPTTGAAISAGSKSSSQQPKAPLAVQTTSAVTTSGSPVPVGSLMAPRCTSSGTQATETSTTNTGAIRASDLTRTFGVEIHFRNGGPYTLDAVKKALAYLNPNGAGTGISTVRDDTYSSGSDLAALGAAGYRLNIYQSYQPSGNNSASQSIGMLTPLVQAGYVNLIEGPLEVDNGGWGLAVHGGSYTATNGTTYTGYAATAAMGKDMMAAFGNVVPIAAPSMANPSNGAAGSVLAQGASAVGGVGATANVANVHYYPHDGNAPNVELAGTLRQETGWTPGMPFTITETGFNDCNCTNYKGTPITNAAYTLNLLLDAYKAGSKLTDLYELFDEPQYGSSFEAHWGLFNADGTPKPAATALRNLMAVIGDAGSDASSFASCGTVNYTLSGLPGAGQSLLTQKADGTYQLLVWNDQNLMAGDASSRDVAVNLGGEYNYSVFDPLAGTAAIKTGTGSTLTVPASGHPVVIQFKPVGASTTATSAVKVASASTQTAITPAATAQATPAQTAPAPAPTVPTVPTVPTTAQATPAQTATAPAPTVPTTAQATRAQTATAPAPTVPTTAQATRAQTPPVPATAANTSGVGANIAAVQSRYYSSAGPTVSGGAVTRVSDGQSLASAVANAAPGSTILVGPGTYAGGITATANNVTIISAMPGAAKIVDTGQSADNGSAIKLAGNNQSLVGFDVNGSGPSSWSAPIYVTGSNATVALNSVHDVLTTAAGMAADGGHGGAAIVAAKDYGGTNVSIIGNTISNVVPAGQVSSLVHGIYPTMSGTVADNVISNVGGVGIHMYHSPDGITVTNNTVTGARDGGILYGSDRGTAGASNITVKNNVVTGSPSGVTAYGAVGGGNVVTNNIIQ